MSIWDPWKGCHRKSEGCKYCYIHKGNEKRGIDTNIIEKTDKFYYPVEKNKKGEYKVKPGTMIYVCFRSDFLIEEADSWREECFKMIKERSDVTFMFLTKRIERFDAVKPPDWGEGYDNVVVGCSVENKKEAAYRLPIFSSLKLKHKNIILQPLIEEVSIKDYLDGVNLVVVGGESDKNGRALNYDWVLKIREEAINAKVSFSFRQSGTNFVKDGITYKIPYHQEMSQGRKANIDVYFEK